VRAAPHFKSVPISEIQTPYGPLGAPNLESDHFPASDAEKEKRRKEKEKRRKE